MTPMSIEPQPNLTKAKLENGKIVVYDACSNGPDAYDPGVFKFIGKGVVYSVNNVLQLPCPNTKVKYFYKKVLSRVCGCTSWRVM